MTTPRKSINPAFLKLKPHREEIDHFKSNLLRLLEGINPAESEEFHKNLLSDFLKDSYYKQDYFINTKGRKDLVIHTGKSADTPVGVIIETKSPANKYEMCSKENLNTKALQELLLYYLEERVEQNNTDIKHLIVTNVYEWFIFRAPVFEKLFYNNKKLIAKFKDHKIDRLSGTGTDFFYQQIAKPFIEELREELEYTYIDIRDLDKVLHSRDTQSDKKLIAPYKLFSPQHLLKLPFANDSNSLDKRFYSELLHLIGLKEIKQGSKKLIRRYPEGERHPGSLLENAIDKLDNRDHLSRVKNPQSYGATREEQLFGVGLELCITWINRILFLKLLEAQLLSYHKGDPDYKFLNIKRIQNYDDLDNLFFSVLAKKHAERSEENRRDFSHIPYLNSSLFEPSQLEYDTLFINDLRDDRLLPLPGSTVLKDERGKKRSGNLNALEYLFRFLDAYDFSSEGKEEIQEEHKTLINASVLGLIFEKINGYKDGSYFTPGFITEYMCRETIRRAVLQKFNEAKGWDCKDLTDLYNKDFDKIEANAIINSLKICDPAVGSGHFLVSALNEILAIKHELRILCDRKGRRLKHYQIEVVNDELIVRDRDDGSLFEYHPGDDESQRVQETLFHEKQTIIENCLFGVDINPNSVKICRLRLWIELLKNAYYTQDGVLETLPNIDINIKCGNSLISRFDIKADLSAALKKSKYDIDNYRDAVHVYQKARDKDEKRRMRELIEGIKNEFKTEITFHDPLNVKLRKLEAKYNDLLMQQINAFGMSSDDSNVRNKKIAETKKQLEKAKEQVKEIEENRIFQNAFEWRFEFPEVLDQNGDFIGFDVVIGNPPYVRQEELLKIKPYYKNNYKTYSGNVDIYVLFYELSLNILCNKGNLAFITPNKWMKSGYGKQLRVLLKSLKINKLIDFNDLPVFDEAITYSSIMLLTNEPAIDTLIAANIKSLNFTVSLEDYVNNIGSVILNNLLKEDIWVLSNTTTQKLIQKLEKSCTRLENHIDNKVYRGVLTGLNEAFVINGDLKNSLIKEDPNNVDVIKPYLAGKNLEKYKQPSSNEYLLFTRRGIDIESYPLIKNHLSKFRKKLEPRPKNYASASWQGRKPGHYKWYEIQDSIDYYREFENPKIIYQVFQVKPCFIFDDQGYYCNNSIWIIPSNDKRLLGILNSKLGWWLISQYCTSIQNGYQLIWKYFKQLPIPCENEILDKKIVELVNKTIESTNSEYFDKTGQLESEIDQLVYELYGLTEDEIRVVEGDI